MDILLPAPLKLRPQPPSYEDVGGVLANFALEQEEPWTGAVQARPWLPVSFADDEIAASPVSVALEQEEPWTASYQARPWLSKPGLDDETGSPLLNFYLEQEEPWVAQFEAVPWKPRPCTDDEITGANLANFSLEDEIPYLASRQSVPWSPRPAVDDEISTSLANFALEDERWTQGVQAGPWRPWVAPDEEVFFQTATPFGIDDDPYQARRQVVPWTAMPFIDEHAGTALKNFALDDERTGVMSVWPMYRRPTAGHVDEPFFTRTFGLLLERRRKLQ